MQVFYDGKLEIAMIIIFGASGGVGKGLMDYFRSSDHKCVGTYNNQNVIPSEDMYKVDVADEKQVTTFIASVVGNEPLYVINCAGITDASPIHKATIESWRTVIDINLIGAFNIARAVLPVMRQSGFGRLINFGSIVSKSPVFGCSAYITSKAALVGFSKAVNIENSALGISSVTINLGYAELGMIRTVPSKIKDKIIEKTPLGRLCALSEIISTVEYAFDCEYIGGSEINLFGGM